MCCCRKTGIREITAIAITVKPTATVISSSSNENQSPDLCLSAPWQLIDLPKPLDLFWVIDIFKDSPSKSERSSVQRERLLNSY